MNLYQASYHFPIIFLKSAYNVFFLKANKNILNCTYLFTYSSICSPYFCFYITCASRAKHNSSPLTFSE